MVKTTVYLPESTRRRLKNAARLEGTSEADIIREAVEARVAASGRGFVLKVAPLNSTDLSSAQIDAILAEGFGE